LAGQGALAAPGGFSACTGCARLGRPAAARQRTAHRQIDKFGVGRPSECSWRADSDGPSWLPPRQTRPSRSAAEAGGTGQAPFRSPRGPERSHDQARACQPKLPQFLITQKRGAQAATSIDLSRLAIAPMFDNRSFCPDCCIAVEHKILFVCLLASTFRPQTLTL
jgi:hypothetical protein